MEFIYDDSNLPSCVKPNAAYTYAKLLTDDNEFRDAEKAISLLEETADDNNWCSFLLGQLYAFGKCGIERDKEKAVEWLTKSSDAGNEYAGALLQHINDYEQAQLVDSIFGLFSALSRIIEDDYSGSQRRVKAQVDRKVRQTIQRKKKNLGKKMNFLVNPSNAFAVQSIVQQKLYILAKQ